MLNDALQQIKLESTIAPTTKLALQSSLTSPQLNLPSLEIQIPLAGLIKLLPEFLEDGQLLENGMTVHLLKDKTVYVRMAIDPEKYSALLDKFTSSVIRRGGTMRVSSRVALDQISPFLATRVAGRESMILQ